MAELAKKIGFIGLGQMGTALATGFLKAGLTDAEHLAGYDLVPEAVKRFEAQTHSKCSTEIRQVIEVSDVVFLAVKPQQMGRVLADVKQEIAVLPSEKLFITIAAGLPIQYYLNELGESIHLARVMPNTPCLAGEGASGFALSPKATDADANIVRSFLKTVGVVVQVEEKQLDAITGLSGSGPAYVFMMIEALADGGVRMGLTRNQALQLAAQTVKGAAEMVLKTGEHPGVLKDRVTSPAGTTIEGVAVLEAAGMRSAMISAVEAATLRSRELGK